MHQQRGSLASQALSDDPAGFGGAQPESGAISARVPPDFIAPPIGDADSLHEN
jgi:hypothetical protein